MSRHVHYTSSVTPSTSLSTASRYNRGYGASSSSSYMHSPTTNTATYSSYLLGKSTVSDYSPSRRYNRYTSSTAADIDPIVSSAYKSSTSSGITQVLQVLCIWAAACAEYSGVRRWARHINGRPDARDASCA